MVLPSTTQRVVIVVTASAATTVAAAGAVTYFTSSSDDIISNENNNEEGRRSCGRYQQATTALMSLPPLFHSASRISGGLLQLPSATKTTLCSGTHDNGETTTSLVPKGGEEDTKSATVTTTTTIDNNTRAYHFHSDDDDDDALLPQLSSIYHDIQIRYNVVRRFLDLMSRIAIVVLDYKSHELLHKIQTTTSTKKSDSSTDKTSSDDEDEEEVDGAEDQILVRTSERPPSSSSSSHTTTSSYMSPIHTRAAQSMFEACTKHGGLLVKMGQYVSTNMGGLVPQEYIDTLIPLQDSCAPLSVDVVMEIMAEEVWKLQHGNSSSTSSSSDGGAGSGRKRKRKKKKKYNKEEGYQLLHQIFDNIDPIPLGSASLAQVHCATLKGDNDATGRQCKKKVAVKVQRPKLDLTTKADLMVLYVISQLLDYMVPGNGFEWMIPDFHKTIAAELDFTQEAMNAKRCQKMLRNCPLTTDIMTISSLWDMLRLRRRRRKIMAHGGGGAATVVGNGGDDGPPMAIVPTPIDELTTERMLTMSFEEGFRITDMESLNQHNIDPNKVATATCAMFAELMHVHGFVHADPHPGNILVRPRVNVDNANNGGGKEKGKGEFDLILLDHGMYRRLDEIFRFNYSLLWSGLISGNDTVALNGIRGLGLEDKYLDIYGLMLVYRLPSSSTNNSKTSLLLNQQKLGTAMGNKTRSQLKQHMKSKFGTDIFTSHGMNQFWSTQPRDLLFCIRCMTLVRGINRELGGTTLNRFVAFGTAASRGAKLTSSTTTTTSEEEEVVVVPLMLTRVEADRLTMTPPEAATTTTATVPYLSSTTTKSSSSNGGGGGGINADDDALSIAKASLNRPVLSEIIAAKRRHQQQNQILKDRRMNNNAHTIINRNWWWWGWWEVFVSSKNSDNSSSRCYLAEEEKNDEMLVPRTMSDIWESYRITFHVWYRSLILDIWLLLTRRKVDVSTRRLG